MKWYYVENGNQTGPVEETQFPQLIQSGKLRGDTLVWREGMAGWEPFSAVCPPEFAAQFAAPPASAAPPVSAPPPGLAPDEAVCVECGRVFKTDDMIRHGQGYVCAGCKPVFMQKLREGVAATSGSRPAGLATLEEVMARDYQHDLGGYLSQAWALFKSDAGLIIGATVLVYLCLMVANLMPYLSWILSIIFTGPLMGGLWLFYLKKIRGSLATVGDAFSGFGPRFGQLLLGNFIPGLLAYLCIAPAAIFAIGAAIGLAVSQKSGSHFSGGLGIGLISVGGVLGIAGLFGMIYLSICWMFTLPLVER